jgi:hypothetical protein
MNEGTHTITVLGGEEEETRGSTMTGSAYGGDFYVISMDMLNSLCAN